MGDSKQIVRACYTNLKTTKREKIFYLRCAISANSFGILGFPFITIYKKSRCVCDNFLKNIIFFKLSVVLKTKKVANSNTL